MKVITGFTFPCFLTGRLFRFWESKTVCKPEIRVNHSTMDHRQIVPLEANCCRSRANRTKNRNRRICKPFMLRSLRKNCKKGNSKVFCGKEVIRDYRAQSLRTTAFEERRIVMGLEAQSRRNGIGCMTQAQGGLTRY